MQLRRPLQVFLTSRYLGIVMEYVTGGDLADMVDVWNVRNRKSHRARGPGEPIPHQCDPVSLPSLCGGHVLCAKRVRSVSLRHRPLWKSW